MLWQDEQAGAEEAQAPDTVEGEAGLEGDMTPPPTEFEQAATGLWAKANAG